MQADNGTQVMVSGRLVYVIGNNIFKGDTAKIFGTQSPKLGKDGKTYSEYGFGLAVPKGFLQEPGTPEQPGKGAIWGALHSEAYKIFPNRQIPPSFHMKFKDGDTGTNQDGSPVNVKTGYPGHIVLSCKTTIAPKFYRYDAASKQNFLINEGIKCGDWVTVQLSIKAHAGVNAGLYLNPNAVQLWYCDDEIVNAPSGDQIFGMSAPTIPAGKSALPSMPSTAGMVVTPNYDVIPGGMPAIPGMPQIPR